MSAVKNHRKGLERSAALRSDRARQHAESVYPAIVELVDSGCRRLNKITDGLNERGIPTVTGKGLWTSTAVDRCLERLGLDWRKMVAQQVERERKARIEAARSEWRQKVEDSKRVRNWLTRSLLEVGFWVDGQHFEK